MFMLIDIAVRIYCLVVHIPRKQAPATGYLDCRTGVYRISYIVYHVSHNEPASAVGPVLQLDGRRTGRGCRQCCLSPAASAGVPILRWFGVVDHNSRARCCDACLMYLGPYLPHIRDRFAIAMYWPYSTICLLCPTSRCSAASSKQEVLHA